MTNIYDTANQLERELRKLPEFLALEEAKAAISSNEESKKLFAEFQELQQLFQDKQMSGEGFSDEETTRAQEISVKVPTYGKRTSFKFNR